MCVVLSLLDSLLSVREKRAMNETQKLEFHLISFAKLLSNSTNSSGELSESIIHHHFASKSKGSIYNKFAKDLVVYLCRMVVRALTVR